MKLAKKLLPIAMLFALPLVGCNFNTAGGNNSGNNNNNHQNDDDDDDDDSIPSITISKAATKIKALFDFDTDFEYYEEDFEYYGDYLTEDSLKNAVTNAASKIDFLVKTSNVKAFEDELYEISGYEVYFTDVDEKFELVIYAYEDEEDGNVVIFEMYALEEDDEDDEGGGGGGSSQSGTFVIDFSKVSGVSGTVNGISFETSKENGDSAPAHFDDPDELRLYKSNTLTIAASGITKVVFTANECVKNHKKADGSLSADKGSMSSFTWTGSANEVTFTVSDGRQVHISSIEVTCGSGKGSGGSGSGGSTSGETATELMSTAKTLIAKLEGVSASSVTFGDYDDTDYGEPYVYDDGSLVFYGVYSYTEEDTFSEMVTKLESCVTGYTKTNDGEGIDEDEEYCDVIYKKGNIGVSIFASNVYDGSIDYSLDVFPYDQIDDYLDAAYDEV